MRQNLLDASAERPAGVGVHRDGCGIARLQSANIGLKYLRVNPNLREIGNRVQLGLGLHELIWQGIALRDVARNRRWDRDLTLHFARFFQPRNLGVRDIPLPEPLARCVEQPVGLI